MTDARNQNPSAGLVLCGGRSRRMGTAKYALRLGSETLLERICRIVGQTVDRVVVVAGPDQSLPELPATVHVLRDDRPGDGPLAGIARGLSWLHDGGSCVPRTGVFVTSCDAPLLRPAVIEALFGRLGNSDAVAVRHEGRVHPLCAVYRATLASHATRLLEHGERRPRMLLDAVRTEYVDSEPLQAVDPDLRSLQNANSPEEFRQLAALWQATRQEDQST